jgi:hypothetical protein
MNKTQLIKILKEHWTDWDEYDTEAKDAIDLLSSKWLDWFQGLGWQEQETIIATLSAIKGD